LKTASRKIVFALAAALLCAGAAPGSGPATGQPAPRFALPVAGSTKTISLGNELAGHRLTVVIFIATRCPYSNAYNARMEAIANDYAPRGVGVLGVNSNVTESPAEVVAHAKTHGLTFPILKDENSAVANLYGAAKTPEAYVIDASGALRYHGRIDENFEDASAVASPDLKNALDALLAGKPVARAETKAFGCTIKRP